MSHFLSSVRKHTLLWGLVLLLLVGWCIAIVLKFLFGQTWYEKQKEVLVDTTAIKVKADWPSAGGSGSTPFLAVWNGVKYVLENDFLFGKPRSYFPTFEKGNEEYEANRIFPDLYKIQSPLQLKDGKLTLQIQEIEAEESFLSGFELMRVAHPASSEVYVDSEYRTFHVLDREDMSRSFIVPTSIHSKSGNDVKHLANEKNFWVKPESHEVFNKNDYIDITFSDLEPGIRYTFVIKSYHRVWVMGEDPSILRQAKYKVASFIKSNVLTLPKIGETALVFIGLWFAKESSWFTKEMLALFSVAPVIGLVVPSGTGSGVEDNTTITNQWSGPGSTGGTCGGGYCLPVMYQTQSGEFCHVSTVEPRGWLYSSDLVELPRESVLNSGKLTLRVLSTECHHVAFVGLMKISIEVPCKIEKLQTKSAYHQRLQETVTDSLQFQKGKYTHTIPGDVIDLEFELPQLKLAENESETYLIRAGGFYTYFTQESKKIAGNWEERISEEAQDRLKMLEKTAARIVRSIH